MAQNTDARLYQRFSVIKLVTPHNHTDQKFAVVIAQKITHTMSCGGVNVKALINNIDNELSHMPISIATSANEIGVAEYIAVPNESIKQIWMMINDWRNDTKSCESFMARFWRELFVEAGTQLARLMKATENKIVGIPMELLHDELMKELFPDDDIQ
jgi:quinol monooxygenase YgiN